MNCTITTIKRYWMFLLLFCHILCDYQSIAQTNNYPVRVLTQVNAPAPTSLDGFANPMKTPVKLTLQLQDLTLGARTVFMKVGVQGPGLSIQSSEAVSILTFNLTPGVLFNVPSPIVAQYFSPNNLNIAPAVYARPLATGLYTFTVEVYDAQTKAKISDKSSSIPVWIELSQPPVLVAPNNTSEIAVSQVQNVLFQWNPRHTQINDIQYEFILTELPVMTRGNIQNLFLSQPPLYKTTLTTNSFLYNGKYPPLREGYVYAWRVQAKAKLGSEAKVGTLANDGISEIYSFRYANPMLAPTSVNGSWGSDFKYVTFTWRGETNHQRYVLSINDSKGKLAKEVAISPTFGQLSNSTQIAGLIPTEKYTYKVTAYDAVGRTAEAGSRTLNANPADVVAKRLDSKVEVKGGLTWALRNVEANFTAPSSLIASKYDSRKQERIDWSVTSAASKKYNLAGATVTLYGANEAIRTTLSDFQVNSGKMKILETVKSDDQGDFKFINVKLAQLKDMSHFYLYINYKNKSLEPLFVSIKIDESESTSREVGEFTLLANTVRYIPQLYDKLNKLSTNTIESVGLYRIKSVVAQDKSVLGQESNLDNPEELTYNKTQYIQVADLKSSNVFKTFANSLFGDQFVLQIKEKGFDPVVYPIATVSTSTGLNSTESFKLTEVIQYVAPAVKVKGLVAYGNETKNRPIAGHQITVFSINQSMASQKNISGATMLVSALWKGAVKASDNGTFEVEVPKAILDNTAITQLGILANHPVVGGQPVFITIPKPTAVVSQNIYFTAEGAVVAGVLKDQFKRPIAEALVSYLNQSVRTNAQGGFVLNITDVTDIQKNPVFSVKAEDYQDASFDISKFTTLTASESKDDGLKFYKDKIKDFSNTNALQLIVTDEDFVSQFKAKNAKVTKAYTKSDLLMESRQHLVLIKPYVKDNGQKKYVSASLRVNGTDEQIPTEGLRKYVKGTSVSFVVSNPTTASRYYLEESIDNFELPKSSQNGEVQNIEIMLKEALKVKGKVTAYSKDSAMVGPLKDVTVKVTAGASSTVTNDAGEYELLVEKASSGNEMVYTAEDYNTEKYFVDADVAQKGVDIKLYKQDPSIPKFEMLQGMSVTIEKSINKGGGIFEITGAIDASKLEGVFKLASGQKLTFKSVQVKKDGSNSKNAVLALEEMKFEQSAIKLILHGYAPIALSGKPAILLQKITTRGQENKGKIVGSTAKLNLEKFLGFSPESFMSDVKLEPVTAAKESKIGFNNNITAANQKKLDDAKPKEDTKSTSKEEAPTAVPQDTFFAVFAAEGTELKNNEPEVSFNLTFPKTQINSDGVVPIRVGGPASLFVDVIANKASIGKAGMKLTGSLRFPLFMDSKPGKALKIEKLVVAPSPDFDLKECSFVTDSVLASIGMQKSWLLKINKIQIFDNFKRYGIGGKLQTSQQNYLNINSLTFTKDGDNYYPYLDMSFPKEGYTIKDVVFKSPQGQNIIFAYNKKDKAYQVDAGATIELKKPNAHPTLKKIFPLEVQKLMVNTAGAFMVAVKANISIDMGPVKVNIRRLLFSKGKTIEWREMNELLQKDEKELAAFQETKTFNNANYQAVSDKATQQSKNIGTTYTQTGKVKVDGDVELDNDFSNWMFGFAGGVQINQLKGAKFKSDASFLIGDLGSGIEVKFNSVDLLIESTTFKGFASIKLSTSGEKVGFEGNGELETVKQRFGAGIKFYQLSNGIEFGASLVASTKITMGSITWSSIGGAVDINTATNKYAVSLLGSAYPTASTPDVTEFRNIKVSVLFSTNDCGAWPVVEGSMDWYNKREQYCSIMVKLDFCRLLVLGTINCDKEVIKGAMAKINATVFFTPKNFFFAASIRTTVLSQTVNGSVIVGANTNFTDKDTPKEVKAYASQVESKYLTNGNTVNGIFLKCQASGSFSKGGNYWIASYQANMSTNLEATFVYNWTSNIFNLGISARLKAEARASILGASIGGGADISITASGGYNNGWYFNASASASIYLVLGDAWNYGCNAKMVKFCNSSIPCGLDCCCGSWWRPRLPRCSVKYCNVPLPCGFNAKLCLSGTITASYSKSGGMKWGASF